jgi:hypothetical protein
MKIVNNSCGKCGAKISRNISRTASLLRLDPMINPLRNNQRFQELAEEKQR